MRNYKAKKIFRKAKGNFPTERACSRILISGSTLPLRTQCDHQAYWTTRFQRSVKLVTCFRESPFSVHIRSAALNLKFRCSLYIQTKRSTNRLRRRGNVQIKFHSDQDGWRNSLAYINNINWEQVKLLSHSINTQKSPFKLLDCKARRKERRESGERLFFALFSSSNMYIQFPLRIIREEKMLSISLLRKTFSKTNW